MAAFTTAMTEPEDSWIIPSKGWEKQTDSLELYA